jgi:hypothetical protein
MYEAMPSTESYQQRRMKLHYGGIEFQQQVYEFCNEKKKCLICSKPLAENDVKSIKTRCDRSVVKTTRKIE